MSWKNQIIGICKELNVDEESMKEIGKRLEKANEDFEYNTNVIYEHFNNTINNKNYDLSMYCIKPKKIYSILMYEKYGEDGRLERAEPVVLKEINGIKDSRALIEYAKERKENAKEGERYYIISVEEL